MDGGSDEFGGLVFDRLREYLCRRNRFRQVHWDDTLFFRKWKHPPNIKFLYNITHVVEEGLLLVTVGLEGAPQCFQSYYLRNAQNIRTLRHDLKSLLSDFNNENGMFINR